MSGVVSGRPTEGACGMRTCSCSQTWIALGENIPRSVGHADVMPSSSMVNGACMGATTFGSRKGGTIMPASALAICCIPGGGMPILRRRLASMMRSVSAYLQTKGTGW